MCGFVSRLENHAHACLRSNSITYAISSTHSFNCIKADSSVTASPHFERDKNKNKRCNDELQNGLSYSTQP